MPPLPDIEPPLISTACLWASNLEDFRTLYTCQYTGAVTTRTACHPINKFPEDPKIHRHAFLSDTKGVVSPSHVADHLERTTFPSEPTCQDIDSVSSLNTYGYATLGLVQYVYMAKDLERTHPEIIKPVIFSVTGDSKTVANCWKLLYEYHLPTRPWCMEINLGCPNIPEKPPPAYSRQQLLQFLTELCGHIKKLVFDYTADFDCHVEDRANEWRNRVSGFRTPIGLKLPPYTYSGQFDDVVDIISQFNNEGLGLFDSELARNSDTASEERKQESSSSRTSLNELVGTPLGKVIQDEAFAAPWPIAFITTTNTLGSSMFMQQTEAGWRPVLQSDPSDGTSGIGGLAGTAIHALALGNVANFSKRLRDEAALAGQVKIIGVGGVSDSDGMARMRAAGADVVGLATAIGLRGVIVFEDIIAGTNHSMSLGIR